MKPRFLLDEHLSPVIKESAMDIICIGDIGVPPKGTLDPAILLWIEQSGHILVTNNRSSMPNHVADHLMAGSDYPGILLIGNQVTIGELVNELLLIWGASEAEEYYNTTKHIP
jgi:Domain of unknown function (DUF5615)